MGIESGSTLKTHKTSFNFDEENGKMKKQFENGKKRCFENALPVPISCKPGRLSQIINGRNPISILNELFTAPHSLAYEVQSVTGPAHCPSFVVCLKIKNHSIEYLGEGPSKKMAKTKAAMHAISSISDLEAGDSKTPTKRKKTEINVTEKNPVSILNEMHVGLKYEVADVFGPPHNPLFNIYVEVNGQKFYGTGQSKKIARAKAAEEALKSFIQFPSNDIILKTSTAPKGDGDFTSDKITEAKTIPIAAPRDKNPVMLLNELYPNVNYNFTQNEADVVNRFKATITVQDEQFIGTGSSKKNAKTAAAKIALAKLISYTPVDAMISHQSELGSNVSRESLLKADGIGRLVNDKFAEVMAGDIQHSRRKVLAGIVMTRGPTLDDAEIICVTTGTKCVSGGHICLNGSSLNDMHAEIIARRCLVNYLYTQLDLTTDPDTESKSIFTKRPCGRGYQLVKGVEFHLYINTAPCGDARIFSPHEDNPNVDRHPNRISRGQLRTKIESGEGTIPIKGVSIQTWDGIIQGERLLTMSCSDKICKWNVLGLQGALLSHFIEPIYLKGIVLGGLMKDQHLYRAICGRIENTLQGLPPPFLLNRPEMLKVSSVESRQAQKAPSFAVIWTIGMEKPEVVSTEKGRPDVGISLVCKQNIAQRFFSLHDRLSPISDEELVTTSYGEAKESVKTYVAARQTLYLAFKKAQLGTWVTKPLEQDMFEFSTPAENTDITAT
ncbi:adenosine deaminase acting on RNA isoform X2 [Rhynchophorus ferrugineus]|uniref:adenosine deaminase acting on RNA isoform X2 n=1 Tax=Rhynchophorus ferrugineus TaxID=354439 RepID=UPI003FCC8C5A